MQLKPAPAAPSMEALDRARIAFLDAAVAASTLPHSAALGVAACAHGLLACASSGIPSTKATLAFLEKAAELLPNRVQLLQDSSEGNVENVPKFIASFMKRVREKVPAQKVELLPTVEAAKEAALDFAHQHMQAADYVPMSQIVSGMLASFEGMVHLSAANAGRSCARALLENLSSRLNTAEQSLEVELISAKVGAKGRRDGSAAVKASKGLAAAGKAAQQQLDKLLRILERADRASNDDNLCSEVVTTAAAVSAAVSSVFNQVHGALHKWAADLKQSAAEHMKGCGRKHPLKVAVEREAADMLSYAQTEVAQQAQGVESANAWAAQFPFEVLRAGLAAPCGPKRVTAAAPCTKARKPADSSGKSACSNVKVDACIRVQQGHDDAARNEDVASDSNAVLQDYSGEDGSHELRRLDSNSSSATGSSLCSFGAAVAALATAPAAVCDEPRDAGQPKRPALLKAIRCLHPASDNLSSDGGANTPADVAVDNGAAGGGNICRLPSDPFVIEVCEDAANPWAEGSQPLQQFDNDSTEETRLNSSPVHGRLPSDPFGQESQEDLAPDHAATYASGDGDSSSWNSFSLFGPGGINGFSNAASVPQQEAPPYVPLQAAQPCNDQPQQDEQQQATASQFVTAEEPHATTPPAAAPPTAPGQQGVSGAAPTPAPAPAAPIPAQLSMAEWVERAFAAGFAKRYDLLHEAVQAVLGMARAYRVQPEQLAAQAAAQAAIAAGVEPPAAGAPLPEAVANALNRFAAPLDPSTATDLASKLMLQPSHVGLEQVAHYQQGDGIYDMLCLVAAFAPDRLHLPPDDANGRPLPSLVPAVILAAYAAVKTKTAQGMESFLEEDAAACAMTLGAMSSLLCILAERAGSGACGYSAALSAAADALSASQGLAPASWSTDPAWTPLRQSAAVAPLAAAPLTVEVVSEVSRAIMGLARGTIPSVPALLQQIQGLDDALRYQLMNDCMTKCCNAAAAANAAYIMAQWREEKAEWGAAMDHLADFGAAVVPPWQTYRKAVRRWGSKETETTAGGAGAVRARKMAAEALAAGMERRAEALVPGAGGTNGSGLVQIKFEGSASEATEEAQQAAVASDVAVQEQVEQFAEVDQAGGFDVCAAIVGGSLPETVLAAEDEIEPEADTDETEGEAGVAIEVEDEAEDEVEVEVEDQIAADFEAQDEAEDEAKVEVEIAAEDEVEDQIAAEFEAQDEAEVEVDTVAEVGIEIGDEVVAQADRMAALPPLLEMEAVGGEAIVEGPAATATTGEHTAMLTAVPLPAATLASDEGQNNLLPGTGSGGGEGEIAVDEGSRDHSSAVDETTGVRVRGCGLLDALKRALRRVRRRRRGTAA